MFRLFLPTIIRELRSLTKVILVIYVYDVNGMMAAKKEAILPFASNEIGTQGVCSNCVAICILAYIS